MHKGKYNIIYRILYGRMGQIWVIIYNNNNTSLLIEIENTYPIYNKLGNKQATLAGENLNIKYKQTLTGEMVLLVYEL